jgi:D-beta-D-heptose 7-phosphate kinase/D-beta-D-heptose 1-phosphate adenosyltransferase
VSDYLKGAITRAVIDALIRAASPATAGVGRANRRDTTDVGNAIVPPGDGLGMQTRERSADPVPLIVDPKVPHLEWYAGATLVTPNHHEAEVATHLRVRTDEDARHAARDFRTRAQCGAVLITRGEQGMWLSEPGAEGSIPSVAREVSDVTGAGDTVVATLSLAAAAGATMAEAAALANQAAGIVVGKFGPATVTVEELLEKFGI